MADLSRLQSAEAVVITDTTSAAEVLSTAPVAGSVGLVVRNIPSGTQSVTGTVTLSSQTVTLSSQTVTLGGNPSVTLAATSVTQPVSGTVTASPSGTQTIAGTLTAGQAATGATILAVQGVSGGVGIPVSGTVTLSSQTVTLSSQTVTLGGNPSVTLAATSVTQPVSGTVTVSNPSVTLAATSVTQPVSGTVTVSNPSVTLAATSVTQPVSGTVTTIASSSSSQDVRITTPAESAYGLPIYATSTGYGVLRTSPENNSIFYDPFDAALDTTNRWNTTTVASGGSITQGTGGQTFAGGTSLSGYAVMYSQPSFVGIVPAFAQIGYAIKLESGTPITNSVRFWGIGTHTTTPTATSPLYDGTGWEIDTSGVLNAVVYNAGSRTLVQNLSSVQKTDGLYHRYVLFMRTDRCFWHIDSLDVPVAFSNFNFPQTQTLPLRIQIINSASSPPGTTPQIICTGVGVGDSGRNSQQIADGTYAWRKAAVLSATPTTTELGLVTRLAGTGNVNSISDTSAISNAGTSLTPKFKAFGAASSGDNTLIALVSSKKLRVLSFMGISAAAMNIYFTTNAAGTVIFGDSTNKINLVSNGGFVLPFNPVGWFETVAGHNLVVNLSAASAFSGGIVYVEV